MGKRFWVVLGFITAALVAAMPAVASARFAYTEAVANDGSLTVTFNEPSQKKSASVNYQLSADATASWICPVDGTILGSQFSVNNTTTVVPGGNGHALGSISLAVA